MHKKPRGNPDSIVVHQEKRTTLVLMLAAFGICKQASPYASPLTLIKGDV